MNDSGGKGGRPRARPAYVDRRGGDADEPLTGLPVANEEREPVATRRPRRALGEREGAARNGALARPGPVRARRRPERAGYRGDPSVRPSDRTGGGGNEREPLPIGRKGDARSPCRVRALCLRGALSDRLVDPSR